MAIASSGRARARGTTLFLIQRAAEGGDFKPFVVLSNLIVFVNSVQLEWK